MSTDKLEEALRDKIEEWRISARDGYMTGDPLIDERTAAYNAQWCAHARELEEIVQAHAAEAAQPSTRGARVPELLMEQLSDAAAALDKFGRKDQCRHLMRLHELLAAQAQAQAAEPVLWVNPDDFANPHFIGINAAKRVHQDFGKHYTMPLYTRPQPAQDAKVMFAPPQTEEDVLAYLQIARLHVKRFREILQDAIAKESGR